MKTQIINLPIFFPSDHISYKKPTLFESRIRTGIKIHFIMGDYKKWAKIAKEVNRGEKEIVVNVLRGKNEKEDIIRLKKANIQKLSFHNNCIYIDGIKTNYTCHDLCINEGMPISDFLSWHKPQNGNTYAIVHLTKYKYV